MTIINIPERILKFIDVSIGKTPGHCRLWTFQYTIRAMLVLCAPGRKEQYRTVVEDVGRRLGLPVSHADSAGLWRAVGRLCDRPDVVESILIQLNRLCDSASKRHPKRYRWHGRLMVAVDVSDVELGSSLALIEAFGGPEDAAGKIRTAHGKLIVALDVRRRVILGWHLAPYKSSERDLLAEVIVGLEPKTVLLLDRGYPSKELFALARKQQLDVIVRMPGGKAVVSRQVV